MAVCGIAAKRKPRSPSIIQAFMYFISLHNHYDVITAKQRQELNTEAGFSFLLYESKKPVLIKLNMGNICTKLTRSLICFLVSETLPVLLGARGQARGLAVGGRSSVCSLHLSGSGTLVSHGLYGRRVELNVCLFSSLLPRRSAAE